MSRASWPELWAKMRPQLQLKGDGNPNAQGWVWARCIDPANHKTGDSAFSLRINVKSGGVRCMSRDCPVGPNLNKLAERLGITVDTRSERPSPEESMRRLAAERLLSEQALVETYKISAAAGGWAFPVDDPDANGHPHIKRYSWWTGTPRFWWPKGSNVRAVDLVYGLSHLPEGTESAHVAAGEVDCITFLEAGIPAISFLAGEGSTPSEKAIAKVRERGIKELWFVYDLDDAGRSGAERLAASFSSAGLDVYMIELPVYLGEGGDVSDLWRHCEGNADRFGQVLKACEASFFYSSASIGSEDSRRILRSFAEFVEAAQLAGDTEYLVEGLFPSDWLLGVVGKPRVGKSLLAIHLARCVALGAPFLGRQTKQGPVVYLALEDPPSLVLDRIKELGEVPNAYVYVGPWGDEVRAALEGDLRSIRPALIIIDPLVATYGSSVRDEADNASIAAHLAGLHALGQAVGAAVLIIHHQRKADGPAGDTIRGGSAIFAAVHCMVVATGGPEEMKLTFLTKTVRVDPIKVVLGDGLSWSVCEGKPREPDTDDKVIFALREKKKASAQEVASFLNIPRPTINSSLKRLIDKDRVTVVRKDGRTPIYGEKSKREMQVALGGLTPGGMHQESGGVD